MWTEKENSQTVADLGGGAKGGLRPPPQGFDPLPTQRVPPLVPFQKSIFGRPTLKFFQRRLWCQFILILRGSARQKNAFFFVKIFQKVPKNGFFDLFFQKNCLRRRKFGQNRVFLLLWESSENQSVRPKKKVDQIFCKFAPPPPPPPPLEKILDPPLDPPLQPKKLCFKLFFFKF